MSTYKKVFPISAFGFIFENSIAYMNDVFNNKYNKLTIIVPTINEYGIFFVALSILSEK